MNKIILISDNQIDTDLFNNQIFLEDTQRSETLASPVSQVEVETKPKEQTNFSLFIIIAILVVLVLVLISFIIKISNKQTEEKKLVNKKNETNYTSDIDEFEQIEKRPRKKSKGQTYATPTSLNEAIKQFLNITKTK